MHNQVISISPQKRERIFLGTTDSVVHAWFPETRREISKQIRLLTLLGYDVVFGAPFVWQSEHTQLAIESLAPLVESKYLGIMGREKTETASDYLKERQDDTSKLPASSLPHGNVFATELPTASAIIQAKNLDALSPLIPRQGGVESNFAKLFLQDLSYTSKELNSLNSQIRTILPTNFSLTARTKSDNLAINLKCLTEKGHFSRAAIYIAAENNALPSELINSINLRATTLYHAANAMAYGSTLFTWANIATSLPSNVKYVHQYSIAPENPYIFQETLRIFGISPETINLIPPEILIRLATEESEVKAFVSWYKKFVSNCEVSGGNHALSSEESKPLLMRISKLREQAVNSRITHDVIVKQQSSRISLYTGMLEALILLKLGGKFLTACGAFGTTKRSTDNAIDILRKQCEKYMVSPMSDFEAFIIKEGLRNTSPATCTESVPSYHNTDSNFSIDEILKPIFCKK